MLATLRVLSVCASKDLLVATMLFGTRVCLGIFSCFVVCAGVFFFVATGGKCCGDFSSCSCHAGVRRSRSVRLNETIWKFVR